MKHIRYIIQQKLYTPLTLIILYKILLIYHAMLLLLLLLRNVHVLLILL
jgi:hypothetical protein